MSIFNKIQLWSENFDNQYRLSHAEVATQQRLIVRSNTRIYTEKLSSSLIALYTVSLLMIILRHIRTSCLYFFCCSWSVHTSNLFFFSLSFHLVFTNNYLPSIWTKPTLLTYYTDVIMGTIASQITSLTIVHLNIYSDADQRKHHSSPSLAFVWGIHRSPVNSRTNGQ